MLFVTALQQTAMLIVIVFSDGPGGNVFGETRVTGAPGIVVWCILSYVVVIIMSWNLWSDFRRVPLLKKALLGCAIGYYAPGIWVFMNAVLWLVLAFMVIPVAMTSYLFYYVFKAERMVPTGL